MNNLKLLITAILVAAASSHPFHVSRAASAISAFYKTNRYKGAFLTCSIKASSADLVAQYIAASKEQHKLEEETKRDDARSKLNPLKRARGGHLAELCEVEQKKKFSVDLRRSAMFVIYGGCYSGCANEFIYNTILPRLGTGTNLKTVAKKVAVDAGLITPLIAIPSAYLVKGLLSGRSIQESYASYLDDVVNKGVVLKNWMIWIPAQFITFSLIPKHMRINFVAGVSFFWTLLLSSLLNS